MEKTDLTKLYKSYFTATQKPEMVHIEPATFLAISGKGNPDGPAFAANIEALYSVSYAVKFKYKAIRKDFVVSKLEGLWWYDEAKYPGKTLATAPEIPRSEWEYRLLIRLPEFVEKECLTEVISTVESKKKLKEAMRVEFYSMTEGRCVQMLHVGPFSTESESLIQIEDYCTAHKLSKNGLHHEIYLSDFRKTKPGQFKTILRESVIKI